MDELLLVHSLKRIPIPSTAPFPLSPNFFIFILSRCVQLYYFDLLVWPNFSISLGWYCSSNIILQRFEEAWKSAILSKCAWNRKNAREKARWRYYSYLTSFARKRIKLLEKERESLAYAEGKREREMQFIDLIARQLVCRLSLNFIRNEAAIRLFNQWLIAASFICS